MFSQKNLLADAGNYSITHVKHNDVTHSIQVSDKRNDTVIISLLLDPMDNTLIGKIGADCMQKLGDDAAAVLAALSKTLQEKIGAKEFIFVPADSALPEFVAAQDHPTFKRLRHASRDVLGSHIADILSQHDELVSQLDQQYDLIIGSENASRQIDKLEERIIDLQSKHANFTAGKMAEYKSDQIQGKKARINNANVTAVFLMDKERNLHGMMRALRVNEDLAYLSDEVVLEDIVTLQDFSGATEQEKIQQREQFLLAYLANRTLTQLAFNQLVIIAAEGRESMYEALGFQSFPMQNADCKLVISLGRPRELLDDIKNQLLAAAPANVSAIRKFSVIQTARISDEPTETKLEMRRV